MHGIEGVPLTLTCQSTGGYPQQTVDWFKGTRAVPLTGCGNPSAVLTNGLYHVNRSCTFTPTEADDGVILICQSSYNVTPTLAEDSSAVLRLDCKATFLIY